MFYSLDTHLWRKISVLHFQWPVLFGQTRIIYSRLCPHKSSRVQLVDIVDAVSGKCGDLLHVCPL